MLKESPSSGIEPVGQYHPAQTQERAADPETRTGSDSSGTVPSASPPVVSPPLPPSPGGGDRSMRLNSLKNQALELQNQLEKSLGTGAGGL
jgi:hypothetical protein